MKQRWEIMCKTTGRKAHPAKNLRKSKYYEAQLYSVSLRKISNNDSPCQAYLIQIQQLICNDYHSLIEKFLDVVQFFYRCPTEHRRDSPFSLCLGNQGDTINIANKQFISGYYLWVSLYLLLKKEFEGEMWGKGGEK